MEVKLLALNTHYIHNLNVWFTHSHTFMRVSSCSASCSMPKKRASSSTPAAGITEVRKHCDRGRGNTFGHVSVYTQWIDAFVDDELSMPQIIQNGFKVVWTAIYQVGPLRVLLVPPDI